MYNLIIPLLYKLHVNCYFCSISHALTTITADVRFAFEWQGAPHQSVLSSLHPCSLSPAELTMETKMLFGSC